MSPKSSIGLEAALSESTICLEFLPFVSDASVRTLLQESRQGDGKFETSLAHIARCCLASCVSLRHICGCKTLFPLFSKCLLKACLSVTRTCNVAQALNL